MSFDFEDDELGADTAVDVAEHETENEYVAEEEVVDFYTEEQFRARGVDPLTPTEAKPGSEAKVLMLAARYAAGLPLWHDRDCYDHGPHLDRVG